MRHPPLPSLEQRVQSLKEVAKHCYNEIETGLAIERILEIGNAKPLGQIFDHTQAVHIILQVRWAFVCQLTLLLMRLHDGPGNDRKTLPQAFALLGANDLQQKLVEDAGPRYARREMTPTLELEKLNRLWAAFPGSPAARGLTTLRHARNNELAHALTVSIPDAERPTYADMFDLLHASAEVIAILADLAGIVMIRFNGTQGIWGARASRFYDALIAGGENLRGDLNWRTGNTWDNEDEED